MSLKAGQQVLIKNPRSIVGTVVRERPGDRDLPEEERHYIVRIEDERFYTPQDLEPIEEEGNTLARYSPDWNAELTRFLEAGQRLVANNNDRAALNVFSEAGSKLGIFVPISDSTKE